MDFFTIVLAILVLAVLVVLFLAIRKLNALTNALRGEEILRTLDVQKGELGANLKSLDDRLHAVTTEIGGVKEVTAQLHEFQASLKSQKLRGNVGEIILEDLLRQVLPASAFDCQHTFKTVEGVLRPDAVIKTRQGLIPVDSKFPVEDFQRCIAAEGESEKRRCLGEFVRKVKKQMNETARYILPQEGTVPFALMYIPFEPVFQEAVGNSELMRYTLEKRVFFTSPQTFLVTIQSILLGLQREKFAEQAEEILKTLHAVAKDASEFEKLLSTAAAQLTNAKSNMDRLISSFSSLLGKLEKLRDVEAKPKG
jgi:DNA recombination protein RmuC